MVHCRVYLGGDPGELTMNIQTFEGIRLMNVRRREVVCNCDAHQGDTVLQIEAQLPNGKQIAIMEDWRGTHLAIGKPYSYNQPLTRAEVMQKLQEAMK